MLQKMLDKNGGFVPVYNEEITDFKLWLNCKRNAEKAILLFTLTVTGRKGRKNCFQRKQSKIKMIKVGGDAKRVGNIIMLEMKSELILHILFLVKEIVTTVTLH